MHRYALFVVDPVGVWGGWSDLYDCFLTLESVKDTILSISHMYRTCRYELVDLHTCCIVERGNF